MQQVRLADFIRQPAMYLPPPEDGLEVTYGGNLKFYISPNQVDNKNTKLNNLANLVVAKLEPKLLNLKNFPISTLVSVPHVKCNRCDNGADYRCWVEHLDTGKKAIMYLCEECYQKAKKDPRLRVEDNYVKDVESNPTT